MSLRRLAGVAATVALGAVIMAGSSALAAPWMPGTQNAPAANGKGPAPAKSAAAAGLPTDAQVADARAKGMVWVNLNTKVYHKDDAVYGKTKNGKFMSEADAQKMGARMAKASPVGKKK
ncbi:hypothetical protein D1Y84_07825 [Acidipila sp. EB88]|nr:hypothetical protein D1Y84_07825 [Acidipila sp. EB88]